jgi:hypothetical protein
MICTALYLWRRIRSRTRPGVYPPPEYNGYTRSGVSSRGGVQVADLDVLLRAVDELSDEEVRRVHDYIVRTRLHMEGEPSNSANVQPKRVLGLHAHMGQAWLSDDFNDELPDQFWNGEA